MTKGRKENIENKEFDSLLKNHFEFQNKLESLQPSEEEKKEMFKQVLQKSNIEVKENKPTDYLKIWNHLKYYLKFSLISSPKFLVLAFIIVATIVTLLMIGTEKHESQKTASVVQNGKTDTLRLAIPGPPEPAPVPTPEPASVPTIEPYTILYEDFEDTLDARISIDTDGIFMIEAGIINSDHFGSPNAFTFGLTSCRAACNKGVPYYQDTNRCIIRISFPEPVYVTRVSFKWAELYGNWGSGGMVYVDSVAIGSSPDQYIGIFPPSRNQDDNSVNIWDEEINEEVSIIDIAISDIANGSQIYIDDIAISSVR